MDMFLFEYGQTLLEDLLSPQKRVSVLYLFSAFFIALSCLVFLSKRSFRQALTHIFKRQVWLSASPLADYQLFLINGILMKLISPLLIGKMVLAVWLFEQWHVLLPSRPDGIIWPTWLVVLCFTLFQFILDDFFRFYLHRLMHKWPCLWVFHQVHHSATELNPFTVFRAHPVEAILFSLRSTLSQAFSIALFFYFFPSQVDVYLVLGVNVFTFMFNLCGSNLRHSNIVMTYPNWLERIFLSPAQHQIHHSKAREHWDKNFGVVLSCWDRWFNSFCLSKPEQHLEFGVQNLSQPHSLVRLYLSPCIACLRTLLFVPCQKWVKKLKTYTEKPRV